MKRKWAFTLAEVLITLGVIGVVSALTIPMLMTKYEKVKNVNQLKKVYSELAQAFKLASQDEDIYSLGESWEDTSEVINVIKYHLKYSNIYPPSGNYLRTMCYDPSLNKRSVQYQWLNGTGISSPFNDKVNSLSLLNGACIGFMKSNTTRMVVVDVNGGYSLPNRAGKDLFFFMIKEDNTFVPFGYNSSDESLISPKNDGCNLKAPVGAGYLCAARIIREGWVINYY